MPLLDPFHPPLSKRRHWENLHSAWANALRDQLNEVLPPRYFAEVQITLSKQVEIDVAMFEEDRAAVAAETGGIAVWAPPRPPQTTILPDAPADVFEVQVLTDEEGPRLVAAVELVSPSNKDRPGHRHAFAIKCANYLYQRIGVAVVDVVTHRSANLHAQLLALLGVAPAQSLPDLYAGAYRTVPVPEGVQLDYWMESLAVGEPLPPVPLWIGRDFCLPLHLEEAYLTACTSSRID
jgi:hypothetical protein